MKYKILWIGLAAALLISTFLVSGKAESEAAPTAEPMHKVLTHRQAVWMYALEWCESRAIEKALNKIDRDGTPSYGPLQFKPGTLLYYGNLYGEIDTTKSKASQEVLDSFLYSYDVQEAIVSDMIMDKRNGTAFWLQQFPDCVKRLGQPPHDETIMK